MSKVVPCIWFNGDAEEAAKFYVSLVPNSAIEFISQPIDVSLIVPDHARLRCGGIITSSARPALCLVTVAAECVQ